MSYLFCKVLSVCSAPKLNVRKTSAHWKSVQHPHARECFWESSVHKLQAVKMLSSAAYLIAVAGVLQKAS